MRKSNRIALPHVIERAHPNTLRPPEMPIHKDNPIHVDRISHSIEALDFVDPILVGPNNEIIDGVRRWKAALKYDLSEIPFIRLDDVTPAQVKALRLALNKLQMSGGWDGTALSQSISDLLGQGFDVMKLGFDPAEIDAIVSPKLIGEGELPEEPDAAVVTARKGDIFSVGQHLIGCGDCCDATFVRDVIGDQPAAACVMDPPYNVAIHGHVSGLGKNKHEEFAMASGEMSPAEFLNFLTTVVAAANRLIQAGGYQYVFMDWKSLHLLVQAGLSNGLDHINTCVWVKSNAGMGSFYRSQHEMVGVFRKPGAKSTNNIKLGKFGRNRTNVWNCRGANAFGRTRDEDLKDHPTVKPVALIEDAIRDCTKRGEIVIDLFGGSGTTMLGAERCGRKARLIEIEPKYVDVTLRRMQRVFELDAVHLETGLTFDALREQRLLEQQS